MGSRLYVGGHTRLKAILLLLLLLIMTATYLWTDTTKNYATFLVWAFRKIYLPINELRELTDTELNNCLTDACAWFTSSPVTIKC